MYSYYISLYAISDTRDLRVKKDLRPALALYPYMGDGERTTRVSALSLTFSVSYHIRVDTDRCRLRFCLPPVRLRPPLQQTRGDLLCLFSIIIYRILSSFISRLLCPSETSDVMSVTKDNERSCGLDRRELSVCIKPIWSLWSNGAVPPLLILDVASDMHSENGI